MTPASTILRFSWQRTAKQRAAWRAGEAAVPEEWVTQWRRTGDELFSERGPSHEVDLITRLDGLTPSGPSGPDHWRMRVSHRVGHRTSGRWHTVRRWESESSRDLSVPNGGDRDGGGHKTAQYLHDRALTGLSLFHTGLRFSPIPTPSPPPGPPRPGLTARQWLAMGTAPSPCPRRCIELIDHKEGTP